jgi:hypothetical protein
VDGEHDDEVSPSDGVHGPRGVYRRHELYSLFWFSTLNIGVHNYCTNVFQAPT